MKVETKPSLNPLGKNEALTAALAVATALFAAMQIWGGADFLQGHTFTYIAIGLGGVSLIQTLATLKEPKRIHTLLIVTLVLAILARFEVISHFQLAIGMLTVSTLTIVLLFLVYKMKSQELLIYEKQYKIAFVQAGKDYALTNNKPAKKWVENQPEIYESTFMNILVKTMTVATLALLIFGSMKLTGTLPTSLETPILSYLALAVGGTSLLLTAYRIYQKNAYRDLKDQLLTALVLLSLGLLALTSQLNSFQLGQALVGTTAAYLGLSILFSMIYSQNLKHQRYKDIALEGSLDGKNAGHANATAFFTEKI